MILTTNLPLFSQRIILDKGDTLTCLTKEQGRFVVKVFNEKKECGQLLNICNEELENSKKIIIFKEQIIVDKTKIIAGRDSIERIKSDEIKIYQVENKKQKKEIKKQKFYKSLFFTTTIVAITLLIII